MALGTEELFEKTLAVMEPGDTLMVMGGTLAEPGAAAEIKLGMQTIIPVLFHVAKDKAAYPWRLNPYVCEEDPTGIMLARNDVRFAHDFGDGPAIGFAKAGGVILGQTVDLLQIGFNDFFFVGKPH